jgi:hypothetical protein
LCRKFVRDLQVSLRSMVAMDLREIKASGDGLNRPAHEGYRSAADRRAEDNPPLIFHPTEEQAPGYQSQYTEALALYRESLPKRVRMLFDRFHSFDFAIKVVGVGSVGMYCGIELFMAADDDPLFLQVKEARASVLVLARAHAWSGDAAMLCGYMGSSEIFDDAICEYAVEYADQTQRDHQAFVKAVRGGRVKATIESY